MGIQMRGSVNVDVSQALTACNDLLKKLDPKIAAECMRITILDTGRRAVKKYVKQEVPKAYAVTSGWVGKKVLSPKFSGDGMRMTCIVPVKGERGTIGGIFSASGGGVAAGRAKGNAKKARLKRARSGITAKIRKGAASVLPGTLPNQGGHPPFRMPNGAVMTRKTGKSHPIVRVVGRAVPQMVDKEFENRMEKPIGDYMEKRLKQVIKWKMGI